MNECVRIGQCVCVSDQARPNMYKCHTLTHTHTVRRTHTYTDTTGNELVELPSSNDCESDPCTMGEMLDFLGNNAKISWKVSRFMK